MWSVLSIWEKRNFAPLVFGYIETIALKSFKCLLRRVRFSNDECGKFWRRLGRNSYGWIVRLLWRDYRDYRNYRDYRDYRDYIEYRDYIDYRDYRNYWD